MVLRINHLDLSLARRTLDLSLMVQRIYRRLKEFERTRSQKRIPESARGSALRGGVGRGIGLLGQIDLMKLIRFLKF